MAQPPGFVDPQFPGHVCKLHKAIYGLKQSPQQWYNKLTTQLQAEGFHFSKSDPALLILKTVSAQIYILIYVDDMLITGNDPQQIQDILSKLQTVFPLEEPTPLSLFLGIRTSTKLYGLFLDQQQYAQDILNSSGFLNCKPLLTPIALKSSSPAKPGLQHIDPPHYRQLAGSLQYLTITQPDIAFATNQICQHMHDPKQIHLQTLKRLLRYIQGIINFGLLIRRSNLTLQSYIDAYWASDQIDRKSISGSAHSSDTISSLGPLKSRLQ
ncbi:hypothetical protein KFK09_018386 [Dendrobium nobile]|uniref:Reverse transcriptase Ty1/copia-type domain-containing protein n=1 Tax=Dendrobium nobile TaxID=94219 RepID=A0A8T3AVN8_DENNO|nr:hypothetical protein KFK09_018386 [Dendrobium nobile]